MQCAVSCIRKIIGKVQFKRFVRDCHRLLASSNWYMAKIAVLCSERSPSTFNCLQ